MLSRVASDAPTLSSFLIRCTSFWRTRQKQEHEASNCTGQEASVTVSPRFQYNHGRSLWRSAKPGRRRSSPDPEGSVPSARTHPEERWLQPWQGLSPSTQKKQHYRRLELLGRGLHRMNEQIRLWQCKRSCAKQKQSTLLARIFSLTSDSSPLQKTKPTFCLMWGRSLNKRGTV